MSADLRYLERRVQPVLRLLRRYHRFELRGLEHFPRTGPVLYVTTHSAATYDAFFAPSVILEETGRLVRAVADRLWFRLPGFSSFARRCGGLEGSRDEAVALLRAGEVVGVAPGGMRDALRPRSERRRLRWEGRKGFVHVWLASGAPMVLAACPAADDILTLYGNPLTDLLYERRRIFAPLFRGIGPTLVPRPIRLTCQLSEPLLLDGPTEPTEARVDELHARVCDRMTRLIAEADQAATPSTIARRTSAIR